MQVLTIVDLYASFILNNMACSCALILLLLLSITLQRCKYNNKYARV